MFFLCQICLYNFWTSHPYSVKTCFLHVSDYTGKNMSKHKNGGSTYYKNSFLFYGIKVQERVNQL